MKRLNVAILAALVSMAFSSRAAETVETGTSEYEWTMTAEFPKFGREDLDGEVKRWLGDIIRPRTEDALFAADLDLEMDGWSIGIDYEMHHPSPKAVSVAFRIINFPRGAAHPMTELRMLNLSMAAGKRLEIRDLFADPQKALEIFAANAKRIVGEDFIREQHGYDDPDDLPWFDDGFDPNWENYGELILEPEGVRVCFQQYQIFPYALGISTPLFPLDMLRPAGPSPDVWPGK